MNKGSWGSMSFFWPFSDWEPKDCQLSYIQQRCFAMY